MLVLTVSLPGAGWLGVYVVLHGLRMGILNTSYSDGRGPGSRPHHGNSLTGWDVYPEL